MSQITAVTKAITNLNEAHRKFNLSPTSDSNFFPEWQTNLPTLTETEKKRAIASKIATCITPLTEPSLRAPFTT